MQIYRWLPGGEMQDFAGAVMQIFANQNTPKYDADHLSSSTVLWVQSFLDKEALGPYLSCIQDLENRLKAGKGGWARLFCNIMKIRRTMTYKLVTHCQYLYCEPKECPLNNYKQLCQDSGFLCHL